MREKNNLIQSLIGEINKTLFHLEEMGDFYYTFCSQRQNFPAGTAYDLIVLAELFGDFYTCSETAFVRISKFFENNLDREKWHTHLLERMIIDIPDFRPRIISDASYQYLKEFLRFRHFRRYYFEFNYDKDRMDFLEKKFLEVLPLIKNDLKKFIIFLEGLT